MKTKINVTKSWKFEIYHIEMQNGECHFFESKNDLKAFCESNDLEIERINELVTGKIIEL